MVGNKAQKAVAAALTGILTLGTAAPALAATTWTRINGSDIDTVWTYTGTGVTDTGTGTEKLDRYDTMAHAVAMNIFDLRTGDNATDGNDPWRNATNVVLVSGTSPWDSLSASALAGVMDAPIVTTPSDRLGEDATRIIKWLADNNGDVKVYVVGGTAAVSQSVRNSVAAISDDAANDVIVIDKGLKGADRVETSLKVKQFIDDNYKASSESTVYVANGASWADALSVSSFSYITGSPILLTNADGSFSEAQIQDLKEDEDIDIAVVGGKEQAAYDEAIKIAAAHKTGNVNWLWGEDRYLTAAEVIDYNFYGFDADVDHPGIEVTIDPTALTVTGRTVNFDGGVAVATGRNWPDALVGGAFIGARDGVLVLIGDENDANWNAALKAYKRYGYDLSAKEKFILGGTSAIDSGTANLLNDAYSI